jgi:hypothetical protein
VLRRCQQAAWAAEVLMQQQPWDGAVTPVGSCGATPFAAPSSEAGAPRVVNILRISSGSCCRCSCCGGGCEGGG